MKFGPLEIRRFQHAVEAAAVTSAPREIGASGSNNLDGYLIESEYNNDLRGKQALTTFDRMLRSDDSVQEAAGHITAPILNATAEIQPFSDELEDLEVAAAVEKAYFGGWLAPGWGWQQHLDEVLDFPFLGCYPFETVWHVVEDELEIDDPQGEQVPIDPAKPDGPKKRSKITLPHRQFLTYRRFDPRMPQTIIRWIEENGELAAIQQYAQKGGTFGLWEIPAEQLLLFSHRRRGHDYTGRSLLRGAYKPWVFKELIEKVAGIGVERHGVGTWVAYLPAARAHDDALADKMEAILRDVRSGAQSYIVAPFPKLGAGGGTEGTGGLIEVVSPGGSAPDFTGLLEYFRGGIKGAMLVRFAELGHAATGARATADVQSQVWYDALHAVARQIEDVHAEAIQRFVRANFQIQRYPKLVFTDIESRSLEEYALAISRLVAAKAVNADAPARAAIRKAVDLPEEEEAPEDPAANQPPAIEPDPSVEPDGQPSTAAIARAVIAASGMSELQEEIAKLSDTVRTQGNGHRADPIQLTLEQPSPPAIEIEPTHEHHSHEHHYGLASEDAQAIAERSAEQVAERIAIELRESQPAKAASRRLRRGTDGELNRIDYFDAGGKRIASDIVHRDREGEIDHVERKET